MNFSGMNKLDNTSTDRTHLLFHQFLVEIITTTINVAKLSVVSIPKTRQNGWARQWRCVLARRPFGHARTALFPRPTIVHATFLHSCAYTCGKESTFSCSNWLGSSLSRVVATWRRRKNRFLPPRLCFGCEMTVWEFQTGEWMVSWFCCLKIERMSQSRLFAGTWRRRRIYLLCVLGAK